MLPESAAAGDHDFPEPGLAFVHAGRRPVAERCPFESGIDTLLIERVPGFVQRREQRIAKVVLAYARGDPHVAGGEFCAERMERLVEPAALHVVAEPLGDREAEFELRRLAEIPAQAAVIRPRLLVASGPPL